MRRCENRVEYGLSMVRKRWDTAGLTDLRSRLGGPVPTTRITVPVYLDLSPDRQSLVWDGGPPEAKVRVKHVYADHDLLDGFVELWNRDELGHLDVCA